MRRHLRLCLRACLGLISVGVIGALLFGWRLYTHPLPLDRIVPAAEHAMSRISGGPVEIGGLSLERETRGLMLHMTELRVHDASGNEVLSLPDAWVQVSLRALLTDGILAPEQIMLEGLGVTATFRPDAAPVFGIQPPGGAGPQRRSGQAVAAMDAYQLLDLWTNDPRLRYLNRIDLNYGNITVTEPVRGLAWRAPNISATIERRDGGAVFSGGGRMRQYMLDGDEVDRPLGQVFWDVQAVAPADGTARPLLGVTLSLEEMDSTVLTGVVPPLVGEHGLEAPISGTVAASFIAGRPPEAASFDLVLGSGRVSLADDASLAFSRVHLTGSLDWAAAAVQLDRLALRYGEGPDAGELVLSARALQEAGGDIQVEASVEGLTPAWLATLSPDLSELDGVASVFAGEAALTFDREGRLRDGRLQLTGGNTAIDLPEVFETPVFLGGLTAEAEVQDYGAVWLLNRLDLTFPGDAFIRITGSAVRGAAGGQASFDIAGRDFALETVKQFWPLPASPPAREWVVENIISGTAPSLTATVWGEIGARGTPLDLSALQVDARMPLRDVELTYWAPLPGATGVSADARITEREFVAENLQGTVAGMTVTGGAVRVTGIDKGKGHERLELEIDAEGPAADLMAILDRPPLGFARFLDLKPEALRGDIAGTMTTAFPPIAELTLDDIEISAAGQTQGVTMPGVAGGRDVTDAGLSFTVDKHDLRLKGKARVAGVPASVSGHMPFAGDGYRGRYVVIGSLGNKAREALGLTGPAFQPPLMDGPAGVVLTATQHANARTLLDLELDLSKAALSVNALGWEKPAGGFAAGKARLRVEGGAITRAESFQLSGPGMRVSGNARLTPGDGGAVANLTSLKLGGGTDTKARVRVAPDGGYEVAFTGGRLDIRPVIFGGRERPAGNGDGPGNSDGTDSSRLTVKLNGPAVQVRSGPPFEDVQGEIVLQGDKVLRADLAGRPAGSGLAKLRLGDDGVLDATAENAGAFLQTMGLPGRLEGGAMSLKGTMAADFSEIDARLDIREFTLVEAPTIMRVLQLASITGPLELLAGAEGLPMTALEAPFTLRNRKLTLKEGRVFGGSLGITFRGGVDIPSNQVDVNGAVVPVYVLNRILSAVPLVGDLLTGGEGVFAVAYSVSGPYTDPKVEVNPLSLLAPGALRRLLTE